MLSEKDILKRLVQQYNKIKVYYDQVQNLDQQIAPKIFSLVLLQNKIEQQYKDALNDLTSRYQQLKNQETRIKFIDELNNIFNNIPQSMNGFIISFNNMRLVNNGKIAKTQKQILDFYKNRLKSMIQQYENVERRQMMRMDEDEEQRGQQPVRDRPTYLFDQVFIDALKRQAQKLTYRENTNDIQYPRNDLKGTFQTIFQQATINNENNNNFPNTNYLTKKNPTKKQLDKIKHLWDVMQQGRSAQDQLMLDDPLYDQEQMEKQTEIEKIRNQKLKNIKEQQNIVQTQNIITKFLKDIKDAEQVNMSNKADQFMQKDGRIQKRIKQFKETLQEKLRKKKQRNLYQFQQKPWQFYQFVFDPNQILLGVRKQIFKIRYNISVKQIDLNAPLQQLNQTLVDQVKQLERKNTGAITKLLLLTEKQKQKNKGQGNVEQRRANLRYQILNKIIKYVKTYGQILIDFTNMSEWQTQMFGSQALIYPTDEKQFLFKFKNGQVSVFQREGNNVKKIPPSQMTLKFLKKNLAKKIAQENSFVMKQFKKLDMNNKDGQNLLIKKYFS